MSSRPATTTGDLQAAPEQGASRTFPCEGCGADLEFRIDNQKLTCPYCGHTKTLEISDAGVEERDFHAMLEKIARQRQDGHPDRIPPQEVRCDACGATVSFTGTLSSTECPYCASPIQREDAHTAEHRVPVDGVLPFQVDKKQAQQNLRRWVKSRWFAPSDFKKKGVRGKFSGVYMPYWTFDTMTAVAYSGQRGEHYYVTVGSGENERQERRTRWYPASGAFNRFFDDVMVCAGSGLKTTVTEALEPWPIGKCLPFTQEALAGFFARTYDKPLDLGFTQAQQRIDAALQTDVRQRIGGDEQRISSINTEYQAITYKHLLLPVWLMAYRYNDKIFQVVVNAATGEVQGERPWSWVKIAGAIVAALLVVALLVFVLNQT